MRYLVAACIALALGACADPTPRGGDASPAIDAFVAVNDASFDALVALDDASFDAGADANDFCVAGGTTGHCITTTACSTRSAYHSTPGVCPGASDIQCCTLRPDVSTNPPIPAGYRLMRQSEVTQPMTDWAVMILRDPITYPMFATAMRTFGALPVLARVEWHPPDFQNMAVHRGVTLYVHV